MKEVTPRDKSNIELFEELSGLPFAELERYLTGQWEWHQLWDYNFDRIDTSKLKCQCKYHGARAAYRRKGYPKSVSDLEKCGHTFTKISGGNSHFEDAVFQCACGQMWKEYFVEDRHYMGNHAYPVD